MIHRHVFIVFVARVDNLAAHAAVVLEAVGKVDGLDVILHVVLGAMPEAGADGAEPRRRTLRLHPGHIVIEGVQTRSFKREMEQK